MQGSLKNGERALLLVVERDPHVKALERYFLEKAGFTVEFVEDGLQALRQAQATLPQILITEILVPKMDGLSVCRALKSAPETRDIVILVFSILTAEERAKEAGAECFLRKPLNEFRLIESVEALLQRRKPGGAHGPS